MYSILLIILFAIFRMVGRKHKNQEGKFLSTFSEDSEGILSMKFIIALAIFKILPLVELFVALTGEWISLFLHPNVVLFFCSVYPILMGVVQKMMDFLNDKFDLELDLVAELYSLFYASLPYKLVYLNIEDFFIGFIVLAIKITFKLIVYVIVPILKHRKAQKKKFAKV